MGVVPLGWSAELVLGCEPMDRQHREIVARAIALQAGIADAAPARDLEQRCAALLDYAREHFATEEGLMLASGYPAYPEHREEHRRLIDQFLVVSRQVPAGGLKATDLLVTLITAWTVPHILVADKQFARFLARQSR